ncbi:hypothetical protein C8R41DRAFT_709754, partial [Lentinula lateritia]
LLDPAGIEISESNNELSIRLCSDCMSSLKHHKIPPLLLANNMYLGEVPPELMNLSIVEEVMIACCRTKSYIIHLKEEGMASGPTLQHALRGNVIIYPQRPSAISKILPPDLDDIASAICVIFIG